jgi:hypothetical protein
MRRIRAPRLLAAAAIVTVVAIGVAAPSAAAYGRADQPLRQIEFSANCNNPAFPLCAPAPAGFGLGGIWLWIEIDANQTGDVAGAGCGHVRGGGGGGAGSIRGDVTWWWSATPQGFPAAFGAPPDANGYSNVDIGGGEVLAFPVTIGHYSAHPARGVAIEVQVAP